MSTFGKKFFEGYELQPHHLPANVFTTLSCFVTFNEAYVGVKPILRTWARYFQFARHHVPKTKVTVECGAATVTPRKGSIFPWIQGLQTCKKWQTSWFYVKNQEPKEGEKAVDLINLPYPFVVGPPPEEDNNWGFNPDEHEDPKEREEMDLIHNALLDLLVEGLTADNLLRTWIERRVSPLQQHSHKMCFMSGAMDPNRMSTFELSKESIYRRVRAIARTEMKDGNWAWGKQPYDRENPPPSVRARAFFLPNQLFISASHCSCLCCSMISLGMRVKITGNHPVAGAWI